MSFKCRLILSKLANSRSVSRFSISASGRLEDVDEHIDQLGAIANNILSRRVSQYTFAISRLISSDVDRCMRGGVGS